MIEYRTPQPPHSPLERKELVPEKKTSKNFLSNREKAIKKFVEERGIEWGWKNHPEVMEKILLS